MYMYMQCGLASCYNTQMVWFQRIHIPTPKMVIGSQKPNLLRESMKQTGNSRGEEEWEDMNRKTIRRGGMDIF